MRWLVRGAFVLLVACGTAASPVTPLDKLQVTTVEVDGRELRLAVADTRATRAQGLAGVTAMGSVLDGLVLAFDEPVTTALTSRGVAMPLDVAWIGVDGVVLDRQSMDPCAAEPCPTFAARLPYRWAIEVPAGGLGDLAVGDALEISLP